MRACAQKNLFRTDISRALSSSGKGRGHYIRTFLRWCIVRNINRLKSSFGCAFVRVHTSLLWLRALYVKTKRKEKRGGGGRDTRQLCGPFCRMPFKTALPGEPIFHDYEKTFFSFAWRMTSSLYFQSRRAARFLFQIWIALSRSETWIMQSELEKRWKVLATRKRRGFRRQLTEPWIHRCRRWCSESRSRGPCLAIGRSCDIAR